MRSIVLNETEWAKEKLEKYDMGNKPSLTLRRVARLFIDEGYSVDDVRKRLNLFVLRCDPDTSLPKWSKAIDNAINNASKYRAIEIDYLDIKVGEIECIDKIKSVSARRLAFTLLCLAKYNNTVNPSRDWWVSNPDNEVMEAAGIKASLEKQSKLYKELKDCGFIRFSRMVDNVSVQVLDGMVSGESAMHVTDLRNLGYQYEKFKGGKFSVCAECGLVFKSKNQTGRPKKYCEDCSSKMTIKNTYNRVVRFRNNE